MRSWWRTRSFVTRPLGAVVVADELAEGRRAAAPLSGALSDGRALAVWEEHAAGVVAQKFLHVVRSLPFV